MPVREISSEDRRSKRKGRSSGHEERRRSRHSRDKLPKTPENPEQEEQDTKNSKEERNIHDVMKEDIAEIKAIEKLPPQAVVLPPAAAAAAAGAAVASGTTDPVSMQDIKNLLTEQVKPSRRGGGISAAYGAAYAELYSNLCECIVPPMYLYFRRLYREAQGKKAFKAALCKVPYWNNSEILERCQQIAKKRPDVETVYRYSYAANVLLMSVVVKDDEGSTDEEVAVPDFEKFIFRCFCESARLLYANAGCMDPSLDPATKLRVRNELVSAMNRNVSTVLRAMAPLTQIAPVTKDRTSYEQKLQEEKQQHSADDFEDEEDVSEEEEDGEENSEEEEEDRDPREGAEGEEEEDFESDDDNEWKSDEREQMEDRKNKHAGSKKRAAAGSANGSDEENEEDEDDYSSSGSDYSSDEGSEEGSGDEDDSESEEEFEQDHRRKSKAPSAQEKTRKVSMHKSAMRGDSERDHRRRRGGYSEDDDDFY